MPRTAGRLPGRAVAGLLALASIGVPSAAAEPASRSVVLVTVDGTTLDEWTAPGLPAFHGLLGEGAVALLSTFTGAKPTDFRAMRWSAHATLGAGSRIAFGPDLDDPDSIPSDGAGGLVARVLAQELGGEAVALGNASGDDAESDAADFAVLPIDRVLSGDGFEGGRNLTRVDPGFPTGRRTDFDALLVAVRDALDAGAPLVVVDTGDTARVQRAVGEDPSAREWTRLSMQRIDRFLTALRSGVVGRGDTLIVLSAVAPASEERRARRLAAVAVAGPGIEPGLLTSGTTRHDGVLALTDVAPTVLARFGIPPAAGMEGRPARVEPGDDALGALRELKEDVLLAHRTRAPATRGMLGVGMLAAVLALGTIASGRGTARPGGRLPRGWRDILSTFLIGVAAAPLGFLLQGLWPVSTMPAALAAAGAFAAGLALGARAILGRERALGAVLLVTAATILVDLALASPLAMRSPLGFQVAVGGRFYGIDEGMLGVLLGATLLAPALVLDRSGAPRRLLGWVALLFAAAVFLTGAPLFGSKFGAPFTVVPALGVLAARAGGRRFDRGTVAAIVAATLAVAGAFAAADLLRTASAETHVARAVGGETGIPSLILRKLTTSLRVTVTTIWLPATIVFAGTMLLLVARRGALVSRALWGRPHLRAALGGALVGALVGMVSNDTGIIVAAPLGMVIAAAFFLVLLAPDP